MNMIKISCKYSMEYYSALKKNEAMPFAATCMDLQISVLSEVSQKEIDKCNMCQLYMESKIRDGGGYLQNRNRLTDVENRLVVAKGKGFGKDMDWEFGSAEANDSLRDG